MAINIFGLQIPNELFIGSGYFVLILSILLIAVSVKELRTWGAPYVVAGFVGIILGVILLVVGYLVGREAFGNREAFGFSPRVQASVSGLSRRLGWGDPYPTPLYQH